MKPTPSSAIPPFVGTGQCVIFTDDPAQLDAPALAQAMRVTILPIDQALEPDQIKGAVAVAVVVKTDEALRQVFAGRLLEQLAGLPLTLVTHQLTDADLNDLVLEQHIHTWLDLPVKTETLVQALRVADGKTDDATHFIAVVGVAGGVGATSLAISLTDELLHPENSAIRLRGALFDLDFSRGSCGVRLDLTRQVDFDEFLNVPEKLDFAFLESASARSKAGMFVLSADQRALVTDPRAHDFVLSCLDAANGHFNYVVLDIPYYATPWFDEVVQGVDLVVLVAENNLDSLDSCVRMKAHIDKLRPETKNDLIFVNKVERKFLFWGGATTLFNEVFPKLGRVIGWNEPDVMGQVLKTSQLPREVNSRSHFVKSARSLARLIDTRLRLFKG